MGGVVAQPATKSTAVSKTMAAGIRMSAPALYGRLHSSRLFVSEKRHNDETNVPV
jgi:hypothetical protein